MDNKYTIVTTQVVVMDREVDISVPMEHTYIIIKIESVDSRFNDKYVYEVDPNLDIAVDDNRIFNILNCNNILYDSCTEAEIEAIREIENDTLYGIDEIIKELIDLKTRISNKVSDCIETVDADRICNARCLYNFLRYEKEE